jgi:hypothetical protein
VSGFLTRLAARGAGLQLADAPAPLAARPHSRFEPLPALAGAPDAGFNPDAPAGATDDQATVTAHASNTDKAPAGRAAPGRHGPPSDRAGPTGMERDRREPPAAETMQWRTAVQADGRRVDDGLSGIRSDPSTSSSDHHIPPAADNSQAGHLRSPALPVPIDRSPGIPAAESAFESPDRSARSDPNEPARGETARALQPSRPDRPDTDGGSDGGERAQAGTASALPVRPQFASDRSGPPPATVTPLERAGPETLVSIGRIDVIFEAEAVPAPQAPRRVPVERTRGFAGYERARRGIKR